MLNKDENNFLKIAKLTCGFVLFLIVSQKAYSRTCRRLLTNWANWTYLNK